MCQPFWLIVYLLGPDICYIKSKADTFVVVGVVTPHERTFPVPPHANRAEGISPVVAKKFEHTSLVLTFHSGTQEFKRIVQAVELSNPHSFLRRDAACSGIETGHVVEAHG